MRLPMETSSETLAAQAEGQVVTRWLLEAATEQPDVPALRWRTADGWGELSWAGLVESAGRLAAAYRSLGIGPGDRIMLLIRNRPEFHVADLAALLCRATPISIYNSSSPEQIAYLAGHSKAKLILVEDTGFLERVLKVRDELPALERLVIVEDPESLAPIDVLRYDDLLQAAPLDAAAAAAEAQPDDLATVIYTSGTTGPPKGVMIQHRNIAWACVGYTAIIGEIEPQQRSVSYLPMAHVAERMVTHYGALWQRSVVTTCPDVSQLTGYLAEVHPHNLFGPPRVFEKLRAGILATVAARGPEAEAGFQQALGVGRQVAELRARGESLPPALAAAWEQVDAAAFAPLRARLGLDQLRYVFAGAAPLPVEVLHFFRALGLPFSEIYGMSENTGGMTWDPYLVRPGTVGRAYPGAEVRLVDGEVVCRGGIVSPGYLDDPQRTADTFVDGWLHSGDIGEFDADGYLRIIDRKKEIIITAGGKNISPANLEAELKSLPLVGQACVVGDGRPYLVALLVLDPDVAPGWAAAQGLAATDLPALAADPAVRAELERGVAETNAKFSQVEGVKRFAVLGEEWQPDSEELTATMKLKRRGVHARYADVIEALYAD